MATEPSQFDQDATIHLACVVLDSLTDATDAVCRSRVIEALPISVGVSALLSAIAQIIQENVPPERRSEYWEKVATTAIGEVARNTLHGGK